MGITCSHAVSHTDPLFFFFFFFFTGSEFIQTQNSKYSENNSQHMYIIAILKRATNSRLNSTDISIYSYPLAFHGLVIKVNGRFGRTALRFSFKSPAPVAFSRSQFISSG